MKQEAYLEKYQKEVKLLLGRTFLIVNATSLQDVANQADSKEVIWKVNGTDISRPWPTT